MTLKEAIAAIGQYEAGRVAGVPRSTVQAWHDKGVAPRWRAKECARIIRAAERAQAADQAAACNPAI
jgi:hypothetical protein